MGRNILVTPLCRQPVERCALEMCEHKGVGHPDSIVDGACEAASRALSRAYLENHGRILHHNLDKGLLIAGRSRPRFGGGEVEEPMRLIVCGRATSLGGARPAAEVATEAVRAQLARSVRCDARLFTIAAEIRAGAASLAEVFTRARAPLANDTSFGCGHAPYSRLESATLGLARVLRSDDFRGQFPAAGDDYKIMGHRRGRDLGFTVALAFVDRYVEDGAHYFALKRAMIEHLGAHLGMAGGIRLNALDDPAARGEAGIYLTVTGLSAEMGDDGQAGRGNRVCGLITPGRAMSLEAAAGKNPVAHVGKLYNVLALLMARDIHARIEGLEEASVQLLARIGRPVDEPEVAAVEVAAAGGLTEPMRRRIAEIVEGWLDDPGRVTRMVLAEEVTLY